MEAGRLKFLADEHVSAVLVRILHSVGDRTVRRFTSNFPNGTPDEVWIPEAVKRGFVIVTYDRKIVSSAVVAPFFAQLGARVIFIGSHLANARLWDQALWMLKYWRKIRSHASTMSPGQLVRVQKHGKIVPLQP